jgi:molybdate transport system ATP-binding protein
VSARAADGAARGADDAARGADDAARAAAASSAGERRQPAGALDVDVLLRRANFTLDVTLRAEPGDVVAVLGPNGAGKSTLLGIVAGLLCPHEGRVVLGGRTLTGDGILIPAEQRRVGLMGQNPLLFPHLTAVENVAFGPRAQGATRATARADAREWLARLGLTEFADRKPARLSGGQRQRVALARALAARPELLLLDEPLGALDAQTAPEIRHVLRTHLRAASLTTLLVTHDVLDAATLADRVVVLVDGAVVDSGPTTRVLAAPRSSFAAALAGLNMITGMTRSAAQPGTVVAVAGGAAPGGSAVSGVAAEPIGAGDGAIALFPPAAVAVYLEPAGAGSPRNTWPATVVALERGTSAIRVRARRLRGGTVDTSPGLASGDGTWGGGQDGESTIAADLTPAAVAELGLKPGMLVYLSIKANEVRVHAR